MTKNRLVIVGAGDLGRQVLHYARLQNKYDVIGFVDDTIEKEKIIDNIPVIGKILDTEDLYCNNLFDYLFIAIGYNHFDFKQNLYKLFVESRHIPLATIIAPNVWIDPSATVSSGCMLYPGATIDKDVVIEENTIININATICHNTIIHSQCYISPCVAIAGFCEIGNKCFIGMNSTILEHTTICNEVIIGAASTITESISCKGTYVALNRKIR